MVQRKGQAYTTAEIRGTLPEIKGTRANAITAMQCSDLVVYALRLTDGSIKIGCTSDLAQRIRHFTGCTVLGFRPGTFDDEAQIHAGLVEHRARGWEYYHSSPEVLDVVNDIREHFRLPPLAA